MAVYFVEGYLGMGKSLQVVNRMKEIYLQHGRPVATNIDVYPENLMGRWHKSCNIIRMPDEPTRTDFDVIGRGRPQEDRNEAHNGAVILDECLGWLNSRDYRNKDRLPIIQWLKNARKLGWDVYLLIQNADHIDSQVRENFMQYRVTCKRLDDVAIPLLNFFYSQVMGKPLTLPQVHVASVVNTKTGQKLESWYLKGTHLYNCYDTDQVFLGRGEIVDADSPEDGVVTSYSLLTPWHTHGRYKRKRAKEDMVKLWNRMFRKLRMFIVFGSGMLAASVFASTLLILNHDSGSSSPVLASMPLEEHRKEPTITRMQIVSEMSITGLVGSAKLASRSLDDMVMRGEDGQRMSKRELMMRGYRYQRFTDCYHEFTSPQEDITVAVCPEPQAAVAQEL